MLMMTAQGPVYLGMTERSVEGGGCTALDPCYAECMLGLLISGACVGYQELVLGS